MRTQTNAAQKIYDNAIRAQRTQGVGQPFLVVITEAGRAAMYEGTKKDMEKIAQAAGVEMPKTARIVMRRGMRQQQETGLKELNRLLQDIRAAKDRESVVAQTGIATGYANAMRHFDLISASELKDVIGVIGQTGERAASRIEAAGRPSWQRVIRKFAAF